MTILFDPSRNVKPALRTFGRGILASRPVYHADHTAADELWWAEHNGTPSFVPDFDALAAEAAAMDALEAGHCL